MAERHRSGLRPLRTATAVDRRRQLVASAWLGGLVVVVLGLWLTMVALGADRDDSATASGIASDVRAGNGQGDGRSSDDSGTTSTDEDGTQDGAGDAGDDAAEDAETDDAADSSETEEMEQDGDEVTSVTFDDVCTVEVPAEELATGTQRPWQHDDCTFAPVELDAGAEAWIVVRASMAASDFGPDDAQERASEIDADGGVLWSSHYPSLNEGLWVVFDGPFPDADAARSAAEAAGGSAYPRALTDDAGDRYCIAADGCTGERAD